MKCRDFAGMLGAGLLTLASSMASAQTAITEQEAHAIGVDAYLYFYPLISYDITRLYSTNVEPNKEPLKAPMNIGGVTNVPPGGSRVR